ncbi:hypothetical protein CEY09_23975 [Achromobacter marplatensis]|uniref:Uncharacterized protein n=1 Tax=Achromobacter marplatensis TaxID=470868 RepID=A0ABX9G7V6_9BURK|nr:hypothetical protein [Achromobacter marplatensis]OWT61636.1 hypothetical protein CEY09_23975 [Achromobacter marplatensis]RBP17410.1 hypothetical protein DFP87_10844 [Achromobacter marplatensis]CAB3696196.1 hypothetical protein LMG26219_05098 [Achromobacter marplatensis]
MNKYETLFEEIVKQTRTSKLRWKQIRRNSNSDLIFNPSLVFRQFSTCFERAGNDFTLLLLEKKYDDPEQDFAFEKYLPELLVIDHDGELVATITDSVIERTDMIRLANLVENRSDKASKLFDT